MKINALVKGNTLDCYDWEHEDRLTVLQKLEVLVEEANICSYNTYNHDKQCFGVVTTDQIVVLKDNFTQLDPIFKDCKITFYAGNEKSFMAKGIKI